MTVTIGQSVGCAKTVFGKLIFAGNGLVLFLVVVGISAMTAFWCKSAALSTVDVYKLMSQYDKSRLRDFVVGGWVHTAAHASGVVIKSGTAINHKGVIFKVVGNMHHRA